MNRWLILCALLLLLTGPAWALGPADACAASLADCERLPIDQQQHVRYLTADNIVEKDRDAFYKVLAFQINSLSREAELVPPAKIAPDLFRVDIRDYGWKREVYEKLADADPYFHVKLKNVAVTAIVAGDTVRAVRNCQAFRGDNPAVLRGQIDAGDDFDVLRVTADKLLIDAAQSQVWVSRKDFTKASVSAKGKQVTAAAPWLPTKDITKLIALTQSQAPILRADWFFATVSRQIDRRNVATGAGYYDFLGLKNQKDAEDLAGLDRVKARKIQREIAAIVAESGVALNNRQVFRFGTIAGTWWETRDTETSEGAQAAIRQLDDDFKPDALEVYFSLPNRLFGLLALNNKGELQATVPDKIAADDRTTSRDHRIHAGLSCVRCHAEGLRPIDDWARTFYADPPGDAKLQSPDYERLKRLRRLYLTPLEDDFQADQLVYARALARLTGWKPAELVKAYTRVYQQYADTPVDTETFARELGVTKEQMLKALGGYAKTTGSLDPVLLGYLKRPPFTARREYVEEVYPLGQAAMKGLVFP